MHMSSEINNGTTTIQHGTHNNAGKFRITSWYDHAGTSVPIETGYQEVITFNNARPNTLRQEATSTAREARTVPRYSTAGTQTMRPSHETRIFPNQGQPRHRWIDIVLQPTQHTDIDRLNNHNNSV